jgi:hypothetical protein
MQGDYNNNKMERLNGEIRDREKTMRNLKKVNTPKLKGLQILHNHIREHQGWEEKKTHAEKTGFTKFRPATETPYNIAYETKP